MVSDDKIYRQNYNAIINTWTETNITFNYRVIKPDWTKLDALGRPELRVHLPAGREWTGYRHYQHEVRALMKSAAIRGPEGQLVADSNKRAIRLFGGHKAGGILALDKAIETGQIGGKKA